MQLNRKGISEQVADTIKEKIQTGVYQVGEKIPGERDMGIELSVSRNTVREAYKILEAYGYITAKHGTGVFVASPEYQIQKMTETFFVSTDHMEDFFSVRKILEEWTVKWSIENSSEEQFKQLEAILKEADECLKDPIDVTKLADLDHRFHITLANNSQNIVLIRIMNFLIDLLSESRTKSIQIPGRAAQSVLEHHKIIEAMKQNNITLAQKYMKDHIESVEDSIKSNVQEL
ncbi:FadR/GntR family transcriptional regulator [Rossellomorea marisflavi]|jgi:GntR family transcriptional regulator, transcriptional repressor for pyruvate dehydrogenase complex|uniref:FadR/GntR family transcriptional regulator n=1 Tax=Rossellomorea marisflavi TaxID=189381 RepID=UPI002853222E|nr:FadR/GntR family transcriptional regulator [Rossellomorea marisflavi]MDR4938958.1 FadR/GntR family transcriptional regulator [Rossellomorea marisflavi]